MKKILLLGLIILSFLISGCGKYDEKDVMKDLSKKYENIKGYYVEGEMEIINNEDIYKYDIKVSYQEPDFLELV